MINKYLNINHNYEKGNNCLTLLANFYEQELNISLKEEKILFNNFLIANIKELRKINFESILNLKNWIKIDLKSLQPYDIIIYMKNNKLSHFSMYVGNFKILDLRENEKSMLRHLNDRQLNNSEIYIRHKQLVT